MAEDSEHTEEITIPAMAVAQQLIQQASDYECYSDQVAFGMTTYTFNIVFALSAVDGLKSLATVRMSAEHAKIFAIMLKRTIKQWEANRGAPIAVPPSIVAERHI